MLQELYISGFRNLDVQTLVLDRPFNVVVGRNGSGKTSLLESIYTLLNGKSFRTTKTKNIVSNFGDQDEFVLRASLLSEQGEYRVLALKKSINERYVAKLDGELANSIAQLAAVYPTQVVEPRSFNLLEGGAGSRRRMFDWLVFHVEHSFGESWKQYSAVLKQRSALLKEGYIDPTLLNIWDQQLAALGEAIHAFRAPLLDDVAEIFSAKVRLLLGDKISDKIKVNYFPGWTVGESMLDSLSASRERDLRKRTTHIGAHKADLRISYEGLPVHEGLSRGQQKLLVLGLHLAQIEVLRKTRGKRCLFLLDDLSAELDEVNTSLFVDHLHQLNVAVFATGLDSSLYERIFKELDLSHKARMFHVEHGKIEPLKT